MFGRRKEHEEPEPRWRVRILTRAYVLDGEMLPERGSVLAGMHRTGSSFTYSPLPLRSVSATPVAAEYAPFEADEFVVSKDNAIVYIPADDASQASLADSPVVRTNKGRATVRLHVPPFVVTGTAILAKDFSTTYLDRVVPLLEAAIEWTSLEDKIEEMRGPLVEVNLSHLVGHELV